MLVPQSRLRRNEEDVAAKVMDGEAIIINLANGMYYSMDKVGGAIWAMIEESFSLEEMVAALSARYEVSPAQAQTDVERLAAELLQQKLVVVAENGAPRRDGHDPASPSRLAYECPALHTYSDMGDLLALDPPVPALIDSPWKERDDKSTQ